MSIKKINGYKIFLHDRLGKGSFGSVYKGQSSDKHQLCAIKIIDKSNIDSDPYLKSALISQIKIMKTLRSDNIVGFIDVMESSNNYYIIQELCSGDLQGYMKSQIGNKVSEAKAIQILTQICNGFLTLVKEGIVHRDLKPANIMISNEKMKIGDFGFAKKNDNKNMKNQTAVGTPLYMPLELLKGEPYTSKCDIWAIGFIFYELIHGHTPWTAKSQFQLVNNILNKPLKLNGSLNPNTIDFLQKTLQPKESNRISWDCLFRHPIFGNYFLKYIEENRKLQNIYKKVMGDIRFRVNSENIHLKNLWKSLGFNELKCLSRNQFTSFFKVINPCMAPTEEQYFYEKMDQNGDGQISLREVEYEFEKHNIPLVSVFGENMPFFLTRVVSIDEDNENMPKDLNFELEKKIHSCFNRLQIILSKKNLTLYNVYKTYDGDKNGSLSFIEFSKIIKRLDNSFSEDDLAAVFNLCDSDHSKTIEFRELNEYFCKVIGIPYSLSIPPELQMAENQQRMRYYQQKKAYQKH